MAQARYCGAACYSPAAGRVLHPVPEQCYTVMKTCQQVVYEEKQYTCYRTCYGPVWEQRTVRRCVTCPKPTTASASRPFAGRSTRPPSGGLLHGLQAG